MINKKIGSGSYSYRIRFFYYALDIKYIITEKSGSPQKI